MQPKLRFPEFSNDWNLKKLDDIAKFSRGKGISKSDIVSDGQYKCIRYGELYTTYKEVIDKVASRTNVQPNDSVLSKAGQVIIPSSGESALDIAKASCVLESDILLGGDLNIIESDLNGQYLSYYLNSTKKYDIATLAQGNSVVHLYNEQLKMLDIKFPNNIEQTKIADFLSAVDKKITLLEQQQQAWQTYKQGMMQKLFSGELRFKDENGQEFPEWEEVRLAEIANLFSGIAIASHLISEEVNSKQILRGANISEGYLNFNEDLNRYYSGDLDLEKYLVQAGDIVISMDGSKVGYNKSLVSDNESGFILIQRVACIRDNGKSYIPYLFQVIRSREFQNYIDQVKTVTAIPHISLNDIRNYTINFPSLTEQQKIADYLSGLDNKIDNITEQLEKMREWKKGLLQQMFV